jgi:hypothetical protein
MYTSCSVTCHSNGTLNEMKYEPAEEVTARVATIKSIFYTYSVPGIRNMFPALWSLKILDKNKK